jgi:hypothetical protein
MTDRGDVTSHISGSAAAEDGRRCYPCTPRMDPPPSPLNEGFTDRILMRRGTRHDRRRQEGQA